MRVHAYMRVSRECVWRPSIGHTRKCQHIARRLKTGNCYIRQRERGGGREMGVGQIKIIGSETERDGIDGSDVREAGV